MTKDQSRIVVQIVSYEKMATSMNARVDKALQQLIGYYEKLVRTNPDTVAQFETATRILSFLVAGMANIDRLMSFLQHVFYFHFVLGMWSKSRPIHSIYTISLFNKI